MPTQFNAKQQQQQQPPKQRQHHTTISSRREFLWAIGWPIVPAAVYYYQQLMVFPSQRNKYNHKQDVLILVSLSTLASCIAYWWYCRKQKEKSITRPSTKRLLPETSASAANDDDDDDDSISSTDDYHLQRAQQLRLSLSPPRHSNFRVVACLALDNNETIFGTNDEASACLSGSLCAERAAFLHYRRQYYRPPRPHVRTIYIVTDAVRPVPPGTACREYIHGCDSVNEHTRIVLQSSDSTVAPWILSLPELYPYPSIYAKLTANEQVALGTRYQEEIELQLTNVSQAVPGLFSDQVFRLIEAAHQASLWDNLDILHPIRYGAAIAIQRNHTIEFLQACQIKALEYSSTQDTVCQLAPAILKIIHHHNNNTHSHKSRRVSSLQFEGTTPHEPPVRLLALVQVDQFGIPHAPFAPARSFLVEHGLGQLPVILTAQRQRLEKNNNSNNNDITEIDEDEDNYENNTNDDDSEEEEDTSDEKKSSSHIYGHDDNANENSIATKKSRFRVIAVPAEALAPHVPHFR